jgi:hypothetical protein
MPLHKGQELARHADVALGAGFPRLTRRLSGVQDTRDDGLADLVRRWLRRPCSVRLQGPVRAPSEALRVKTAIAISGTKADKQNSHDLQNEIIIHIKRQPLLVLEC